MAEMTQFAEVPALRGFRRAPIRQVLSRVGDELTQRRVVDFGRTGSSVCRSH
jgi:hypothetical protein